MVWEGTGRHGEEAEGRLLMRTDFLSVFALAEDLLPRDQRPVTLRRQTQRALMGVALDLRDHLHLL